MSDDPSVADLAALAHRLADAAAAVTMRYFRTTDLVSDDKTGGQGFDPVTIADRNAETAIRALLERERPEDGILGEEQENKAARSRFTWVIDPIDGTRSFISGLPLWGTLIALDDGERGIIGLVDQPFTQERFIGVHGPEGSSATLQHRGPARPIRTRRGRRLAEASVFSTAPQMFAPEEWPSFETVSRVARLTRYGTDCYAYALLAAGMIDLVIEAGLQAFDIAAPKALIEAAGGVVTDWHGNDCRWGGRVLAAAHPALHAEALEILSKAPGTG